MGCVGTSLRCHCVCLTGLTSFSIGARHVYQYIWRLDPIIQLAVQQPWFCAGKGGRLLPGLLQETDGLLHQGHGLLSALLRSGNALLWQGCGLLPGKARVLRGRSPMLP
jgi:hypothetical protein